MIAYKYRFHGYNALRFVYKNGSAKRCQYFTLKYTQNPRRSSPRFAVVVSKKIHKGAVGRNRIRRRLYELFRNAQQDLPKNHDIVLIVSHKEVMTMEPNVLRTQFEQLLQEAGLYNKSL